MIKTDILFSISALYLFFWSSVIEQMGRGRVAIGPINITSSLKPIFIPCSQTVKNSLHKQTHVIMHSALLFNGTPITRANTRYW